MPPDLKVYSQVIYRNVAHRDKMQVVVAAKITNRDIAATITMQTSNSRHKSQP